MFTEDNFTTKGLRDLCDRKGIAYTKKSTKAELIIKLNEAYDIEAEADENGVLGEY